MSTGWILLLFSVLSLFLIVSAVFNVIFCLSCRALDRDVTQLWEMIGKFIDQERVDSVLSEMALDLYNLPIRQQFPGTWEHVREFNFDYYLNLVKGKGFEVRGSFENFLPKELQNLA